MMKRFLLLLALLLLLCACSRKSADPTAEPEPPVAAVMSTYQGQVVLEGAEYAALFDEMLRSAIEQDLDDAPPLFYQVTVSYSQGKTVDFVLFPDPVSENVYLVENEKTFRAARQYAEQFLALDVMAPAYLPPAGYQLRITSPVSDVRSRVKEYDFTYLIPSGWKSIRSVEDPLLQQVAAAHAEDVTLAFSQEPDEWSLRYLRKEDGILVQDPGPGNYLCQVRASYTEPTMGRYSGDILFEFELTLYGDPVLTLSSDSASPGGLLALRVEQALPGMDYSLTGTHTKEEIPLRREDESTLLALIPLGPDVSPGHYTLFFFRSEESANTAVIAGSSASFTVTERRFQTIRLSPEEEGRIRLLSDAQEKARAVLDKAGADTLLSSVPFVSPVQNTADLGYGVFLETGTGRSYRHHGVDFPVTGGQDIACPGTGRILAVTPLAAGSDLMVLDHGCGIVSVLAYLDAEDLNTGDSIAAGYRIGTVPEDENFFLHYALYVNGTPVDPAALESHALWDFLLAD